MTTATPMANNHLVNPSDLPKRVVAKTSKTMAKVRYK